ncbi:hypothetical protein HUJ05_000675 [Dendroctonus ponderosae]|nr:hypothetical protein HUJ05_000675 [Dendroctonus ponderosae]
MGTLFQHLCLFDHAPCLGLQLYLELFLIVVAATHRQSESETRPSSNADSLDDSVIRSKIDEANQLIARVKKALGKIKARKPCEGFEANSSSTDIEETIRALKQETEQLITGDADAEENQLQTPTPVEDEEIVVAPPRQTCPHYRNPLRNIELQRPKTRRNEADDDLSGPVQRNKFITRPDIEQLATSSSFEQLQEKLETISETTESTPRKPAERREQLDKACNTAPLTAESKEVQVAPETNTVGACCSCPKENKKIQANGGWTKKNVAIETEPLSLCKPLEIQNLPPADIPSRRKCSTCQAEFLPLLEILPIPQVCDKCKVVLQHENLPSCCIRPKSKLKKLTIQVLPPIVIKQGLTLRQVLNLSIGPNGKSSNQVQDTENVAYFATTSNDLRVSWSSKKNEDVWFNDEPISGPLGENEENFNSPIVVDNNEIDAPDVETVEVQHQPEQDPPHFPTFPTSQSSCSQPEAFLHDIDNESQFVSNSHLQPPGNINDLLAELADSRNLSPELEAQLRNRILWYKSYHIFDNPNKHDPGPLDKKSLEKLSQIDLQFYKTFINPNPTLSQEIFTPHQSRNKLMGFESKMVQCNESMLLDEPQAPEAQKTPMADKENELESTITVLRMKEAEKKQQNSLRESHPESYSSPSEVTVTISYSVSSEERLRAKDSKKSTSEMHETEVKTIDLDDYQELPKDLEDKVINVKDKEVISKLKDKLKSVDTKDSQPIFTLRKQTADEETVDQFLKGLTKFKENKEESGQQHSVDSSSNDSQNGTTSVNYLLSQHLELGKNGRYRDEENLFAQVPHPKIVKPVKELKIPQRDQEIARPRPRHQLHRFLPDTSNSETVTSNSLSEGEVRCKHSVSNGEIHPCRSRWPPRRQRTILTKRNFPLPLTHHEAHNRGTLGKFNLDDPKLAIEQRRNYFNNWVTYYVKPQDHGRGTSDSLTSKYSKKRRKRDENNKKPHRKTSAFDIGTVPKSESAVSPPLARDPNENRDKTSFLVQFL